MNQLIQMRHPWRFKFRIDQMVLLTEKQKCGKKNAKFFLRMRSISSEQSVLFLQLIHTNIDSRERRNQWCGVTDPSFCTADCKHGEWVVSIYLFQLTFSQSNMSLVTCQSNTTGSDSWFYRQFDRLQFASISESWKFEESSKYNFTTSSPFELKASAKSTLASALYGS